MIHTVFEVVKLVGWLAVIALCVYKRKEVSVDMFWLILISSVLMSLGSLDDLMNLDVLLSKSSWWLPANLFVIVSYIYMLRRGWVFFGKTNEKLSDFVRQIEDDREKLNEEGKR